MALKQRTIEDKFWRNVERSDDCWAWCGTFNDNGYGVVFHNFEGKQKQYRAHRVSYMLHHGAMPDGLVLMHTCDNPWCVNPSHLIAGTQADNLADMCKKGRHKINPEKVRGEASGMAKMNDMLVREIRQCYAAGNVSQAKIARKYNLVQSTVSSIVLGKTWGYVT